MARGRRKVAETGGSPKNLMGARSEQKASGLASVPFPTLFLTRPDSQLSISADASFPEGPK